MHAAVNCVKTVTSFFRFSSISEKWWNYRTLLFVQIITATFKNLETRSNVCLVETHLICLASGTVFFRSLPWIVWLDLVRFDLLGSDHFVTGTLRYGVLAHVRTVPVVPVPFAAWRVALHLASGGCLIFSGLQVDHVRHVRTYEQAYTVRTYRARLRTSHIFPLTDRRIPYTIPNFYRQFWCIDSILH